MGRGIEAGAGGTVGEGVLEQAGAVPYRVRDDGQVEILLITNTRGEWIVPKGRINPGQTARQSALAEAREEAGVIGVQAGMELGWYLYEKAGRPARVRLFALRVARVMSAWPEQHRRRRRWVLVEEALERVRVLALGEAIATLARAERRLARRRAS